MTSFVLLSHREHTQLNVTCNFEFKLNFTIVVKRILLNSTCPMLLSIPNKGFSVSNFRIIDCNDNWNFYVDCYNNSERSVSLPIMYEKLLNLDRSSNTYHCSVIGTSNLDVGRTSALLVIGLHQIIVPALTVLFAIIIYLGILSLVVCATTIFKMGGIVVLKVKTTSHKSFQRRELSRKYLQVPRVQYSTLNCFNSISRKESYHQILSNKRADSLANSSFPSVVTFPSNVFSRENSNRLFVLT